MEKLILPLGSMLALLISLTIIYFFMKKKAREDAERQKKEESGETAADFTNILDIDGKNSILYTTDNKIISIISLASVSLELMSETKRDKIARDMIEGLSKYNKPWKLIAISRPVDTRNIIDKYSDIYQETDSLIRKKLLKNAISNLEQYTMAGDIVKRDFYFVIWEDSNKLAEFLSARNIFISNLNEAGTRVNLADKAEMIKVCNLFFNPQTVVYEDYETMDMKPRFMKV